jgi:hypothetical protein
MKKNRLVVVLSSVLLLAVIIILYSIRLDRDLVEDDDISNPFRPMESKFLVPAQEKESALLKISKGLVKISRSKDENHVWQVLLEDSSGDPKTAVPALHLKNMIGLLYSNPFPPFVTKPVFLCSFKNGVHANLSLDPSEGCSGEGTLVRPKPVGYVSSLIRSGFLMAVRCKNREAGMYLSLNARCESPKDVYQQTLGAIRAYTNKN